VTFEEWAATTGMSHCEYSYAKHAWQAAQEAERERTTAIMLKHLAQWNVPWSENVDKAVKEINELDT
jgi:AICAR transformylase/IMP cyclohydrolase PurH